MAEIRLIAGLGNPGPQYERTRHNAGFIFVRRLIERESGRLESKPRFHGDVARISVGGQQTWCLLPSTFMNLSGTSVAAMAGFYQVEPEQILVVYDELDLPPGTARLKFGGGAGGHNGIRDTVTKLGSRDFWRLRLGIGHPGSADKVVGYVLKPPSAGDLALIDAAMTRCLDCIDLVVAGEQEKVMSELHRSTPA